MSGRIAHRPRYRKAQQLVPHAFMSRRKFFPQRWSYRRQKPLLEKHPLGYSLAMLPIPYRRLAAMVGRSA